MGSFVNVAQRILPQTPRQWVRNLVVAPLAILAAYLVVDFFNDYAEVMEVKGGIVVPASTSRGSVITVQWSVEWLRLCPAKSDRFITDSSGTRVIVDTSEIVPPGHTGPDVFKTVIELPPQIAEGPAFYHAVWYHTCNWQHRLWPKTTRPPVLSFQVDGTGGRFQEIPPRDQERPSRSCREDDPTCRNGKTRRDLLEVPVVDEPAP